MDSPGIPHLHTYFLGVKACGVTYDFQPDSFRDEPPDLLVDRMEELAAIVLAGRVPQPTTHNPQPL